MTNSKVSIILPIYNAENYLEKCLNSVISQTLSDIEIVCVNDGSTDKSLEILENFAKKDNRIKIISQQNGGMGKAYNTGLDNSIGEYIGFVEPDDFVLTGMFEELYNCAKQNDLDFVKSDYIEFSKDNETRKNLTFSKEYYNKILNPSEDVNVFNFAMNIWTGIYKKDLIKNNNIRFNETTGASFQDNGFWFQSFIFANKIMFLDKAFYQYRVDNPNSSINAKNKVNCMFEEYDFIKNILDKNQDKKEKFIKIFQLRRFKNYKFLYNKLVSKYRYKFLKRVQKDYKEAYKQNEIDESLFRSDEIKDLKMIINFPEIKYLMDNIKKVF